MLEDCPFCGYDNPEVEQTVIPDWEYSGYIAGCPLCYACGPANSAEENAIRDWNAMAELVQASTAACTVLYGMLLSRWGHPDDWPNASGKVIYDRLRDALLAFERSDDPDR